LEPLAKTELLRVCLRTETHVLAVGRDGCLKGDDASGGKRGKQPFRLLIRDSNKREQSEEGDGVLDWTGAYGQHRRAVGRGIRTVGDRAAEPHIIYGLEDMLGERRSSFAGKTVLVAGAGYSAATTVCNLATLSGQHPDTWVIWLARGSGTQPLPRISNDPLRERDRLAVRANTLATGGEGNVEFHNQSVIEAIESLGPDKGFRVTARVAGKPRTWEADRLIANVGFTPDTSLYRELQVHECYASLGPM